MIKFFKEVAIYILIIALIVLIFGILFYEQLPTNKLVPIASEYALPENLENVLEDTLSDKGDQEVLVTYTVEQNDLDKYKESDQYDPGKIDPFADYSTGEDNSGDNNNNNGNSGNTKNNSNSSNNNSNTNGNGGGKLTETKPGK